MGVTYKLKRKTGANTTEEVLFPIASVDGLQTALNGKLGTSAKAADSAKLNGQAASYYLNYTNLTNKPTIPTATSQLTNDSGFLTTETYKGTVTSVKVGTTSYTPSSGVVSLPAYPTVPTQTSQLTNNSDFATNASVDTKIANLVNSAPEALDTLGELATALQTHEDAYDALLTTVGGKVDKVSGKGLSTNDYTTAEKNKLAGIASGAEVNVQSDWNATSGDAFIKNKPTIPSVGNGTITIKQAGAVKGTFTTNQSGDATIELTDNNTTVLPTRLAASSTSGYNDANLAVEQGWHYMTSTGTNRPPFKQVDGQTGNDYRIMTTAYGSTWLQQIATDFRSNDMFVRRCQNGTWQAWTPIVKMGQGATPLPTDNALPRWDATRNATLQSSGVIVDDSNNMSGVATLTATKFVGALNGNADSANIATQALTATTAMDSQKLGGVLASQYALNTNIPSVGNGTITVKQAGTTKSTFTTNQSDNTTIELSDSYVIQTHTTTNANYPLLFKLSSGITTTGNTTNSTRYANNIYVNPSTGTIYANDFVVGGKSIVGGGDYDSIHVGTPTYAEYDGDGIWWDGVLEFNSDDGSLEEKPVSVVVPFIAGDGIKFTQNSDGDRMVISTGIQKIATIREGGINPTASTEGAYFKIAGSVAAAELFVGDKTITLDSSYTYFVSIEGMLVYFGSDALVRWNVMVVTQPIGGTPSHYAFMITTTTANGVHIGDDAGEGSYSGILCE